MLTTKTIFINSIFLLISTVNFYSVHAQDIPYAERILVFSPHPDDDVLGCGGTLIKQVGMGSQVTVVYVTAGDASDGWHGTKEELILTRENEAKKATEKMGISDLVFLRGPDGKLSVTKERVKKVTDLIAKYRPDIIFVPHAKDGHKDHQKTFHIVKQALTKGMHTESPWHEPLILCYEVWTPLKNVTHDIDISDVMDKKLSALAEHKSQLAYFDYIQLAKMRGRNRGKTSGRGKYAEGFKQLVMNF